MCRVRFFDIYEGNEGDTFEEGWKNKLIWGDNDRYPFESASAEDPLHRLCGPASVPERTGSSVSYAADANGVVISGTTPRSDREATRARRARAGGPIGRSRNEAP